MANRLPAWQRALLIIMLVAAMATLAMIRDLDHDESQYVAATQLALSGLPYRDFAYLQTPLQPMLFSPLAAIFPLHLFVALRLVNALCGAASIMLLHLALVRAGASARSALLGAGLMALCEPLLFASAVARNDALPLMLFCGSLALLAGPATRRAAFFAALLMAGAAAAKISYAIPTAALLALTFAGPRAVKDRLPILPVMAGLAIPTLFVLALAALAPDAFIFQVLTYGMKAPEQWYGATGRAASLGWKRILKFLLNGMAGPALMAVLVCAGAAWRSRHHQFRFRPRRAIFGALLAAGLIGAFLPNPTHPQYWVPALPPLFLCLGLAFDRSPRMALPVTALFAVSACSGLANTADEVAEAISEGDYPAMKVTQNAAAMRALMDDHGVRGPVAGLNPELFADAGRPVDPRFVTGPFLFRTIGLMSIEQERRWRVMAMNHVPLLRSSPPAAIVITSKIERYKGSAFLRRKIIQGAMMAGFSPVGTAGGMILFVRRARPRTGGGSSRV